jgi:hypothetical protein
MSQIPVPDEDIFKLVSALDGHNLTCTRLEPATFVAILETLLQAEYSRQKERGLVLLAVGNLPF